jgi:hypothetical protein
MLERRYIHQPANQHLSPPSPIPHPHPPPHPRLMARCTPTHLPIHPYIHPSIYMSQYPYTTLLFPQPSSKIHCKSLLTGLQILHNQSQTHLLLVHVHTARQTDRQPSLRLPCFASCNATPECKKKNKKTKKYTVCQISTPPQAKPGPCSMVIPLFFFYRPSRRWCGTGRVSVDISTRGGGGWWVVVCAGW